MFLDDIFKTNFATNLACDYEKFIQKPKSIFSMECVAGYTTIDFVAKSKLFENLLKSYNGIVKECEKTEMSFRASEEANRIRFYEKSSFTEGIKAIPYDEKYNSENPEIIQGEKPQMQDVQETDGK